MIIKSHWSVSSWARKWSGWWKKAVVDICSTMDWNSWSVDPPVILWGIWLYWMNANIPNVRWIVFEKGKVKRGLVVQSVDCDKPLWSNCSRSQGEIDWEIGGSHRPFPCRVDWGLAFWQCTSILTMSKWKWMPSTMLHRSVRDPQALR